MIMEKARSSTLEGCEVKEKQRMLLYDADGQGRYDVAKCSTRVGVLRNVIATR